MRILLTSSAHAFAGQNGWVDYLESLQLGSAIHAGDRLALTDEPEHDFKVMRRRIVPAIKEPTLDFPAGARPIPPLPSAACGGLRHDGSWPE